MKKILLTAVALLGSVSASAGAYGNIAYRRAVYQSSAADFNRVGHLVTDGLLEGREYRGVKYSCNDPSKSPAGERYTCAFDGKKDSKYLTFGATGWLQVESPVAIKPVSYAIVSANDDPARDPSAWRLLASDDGKNFKPVDEQKGVGFSRRHEAKTFKIADPSAHRFYRLEIVANNGDGAGDPAKARIQLAEFDLVDGAGKSLVRSVSSKFVSAWASAGAKDEWVYVDLGAASKIDKVILDWSEIGYATAYDVQVSSNAADWKTVASKTGGKGGTESVSFAAVEARYVRLFCRETAADGFSLAEMKVMGSNNLPKYALPAAPAPAADGTLRLTGGNWRIARAPEVDATGEQLASPGFDDSAWLPAVVPGTALTSYLSAGAIPDMNFGDRQLMVSDSYFTCSYWYRNTFRIKAPAKGGRVWLNFEAVNWKADVYLNGRNLGRINGAFLRKSFDITEVARFDGDNQLAVYIHMNDNPGEVTLQDRNHPGKNGGVLGRDNPTIHASVGWDWVPTIRGRNVGIYRDVTVSYSGDVTLRDGWVVTELDVEKKDFSKAQCSMRVRASNASSKSVVAVIEGTVEPGAIKVKSEPVTLAPGETREVTVGDFTIDKPALWWPVTYGKQPLYGASISASVNGVVSDREQFKFGVRKFTFKKDKPMEVYCNGTRIVCRGGNWGMDDANLACTPFGYDTKVRLHAEANLTMIRNWVGMTNSDDFYKACDKYGVLVWDDFWLANPSDGPDPKDVAMFLENARDKVLKNRYHASIPFYCGRNEGNPPKNLFDELPKIVNELDGTRHYIPHSAGGAVSGFGPYGVQKPTWYFHNAPVTLHSERGQPNIPEIESMRAMLTPEHYWPIDDVWGQHDFTGGGAQSCNAFRGYIRNSYAEPSSLEEFTRLAQLVEYENHKAMFESVYSVSGNGILMWMSQSAWPSMVWQTYDWWHDVNGGYWGSKVGNQPVNVILNQDTKQFFIVNATAEPLAGATAKLEFFDVNGKPVRTEELVFSLESDAKRDWIALEPIPGATDVLFIRATVKSAKGAKIAENFTWVNVREERRYQSIYALPATKPSLGKVEFKPAGDGVSGSFELKNETNLPQIMVRAKLVDSAGERVLPVHWSENYVSLMPGESRAISFVAPVCAQPKGKGKLSIVLESFK